jgi:hypothetical protein
MHKKHRNTGKTNDFVYYCADFLSVHPYPLQFPSQFLEIPLTIITDNLIDRSTILYEENFTQPVFFIPASVSIYN